MAVDEVCTVVRAPATMRLSIEKPRLERLVLLATP